MAHSRNLRSLDNDLLRIQMSKTSFMKIPLQSQQPNGNVIPLDIHTIEELNEFKSALSK